MIRSQQSVNDPLAGLVAPRHAPLPLAGATLAQGEPSCRAATTRLGGIYKTIGTTQCADPRLADGAAAGLTVIPHRTLVALTNITTS